MNLHQVTETVAAEVVAVEVAATGQRVRAEVATADVPNKAFVAAEYLASRVIVIAFLKCSSLTVLKYCSSKYH